MEVGTELTFPIPTATASDPYFGWTLRIQLDDWSDSSYGWPTRVGCSTEDCLKRNSTAPGNQTGMEFIGTLEGYEAGNLQNRNASTNSVHSF
jgi:hypothetical protein